MRLQLDGKKYVDYMRTFLSGQLSKVAVTPVDLKLKFGIQIARLKYLQKNYNRSVSPGICLAGTRMPSFLCSFFVTWNGSALGNLASFTCLECSTRWFLQFRNEISAAYLSTCHYVIHINSIKWFC